MKRDFRVVVVTRKTPLDHLVARHGTVGQADFFLRGQGLEIAGFEAVARAQRVAVAASLSHFGAEVRRVHIDRDELDRFVFHPDDVILAVGQDGLVANVAKYLDGQPVVGINPDPRRYDGVLCSLSAGHAAGAVHFALSGEPANATYARQMRTLAEARRGDGLLIRALNEVFIGHKTHQSAVYTLAVGGASERQSSSGVIVSTGTGCTGWGRSIATQRGLADLPAIDEPSLAWFVREPFPSVSTGCNMNFGRIGPGESLRLGSEMGTGGTAFGDGIEADNLDLPSGQSVEVTVCRRRLALVGAPVRRPARTR
ncbi:MAG: hypothetical protein FJ090_12930 [Deltaproteobacteria bacterium]|nr:hypothetical protein [Deltaproteobacteria bacterium]